MKKKDNRRKEKQREDQRVIEAAGGGRAVSFASWLRIRGDDGFEILTFPALFPSVAVGSLRDLLCLVDCRLLDVCAIHLGWRRVEETAEKRFWRERRGLWRRLGEH